SFLLHLLSPTSYLVPSTTLFRSESERPIHLGQSGRRKQQQPHDACRVPDGSVRELSVRRRRAVRERLHHAAGTGLAQREQRLSRSEEHTSELQSRENLVCRLLLE